MVLDTGGREGGWCVAVQTVVVLTTMSCTERLQQLSPPFMVLQVVLQKLLPESLDLGFRIPKVTVHPTSLKRKCGKVQSTDTD